MVNHFENLKMVGGCLCGAIRYEVLESPTKVANCHCSMCRKHSGAAYLTYLATVPKGFSLIKGELAIFRSSDQAIRCHCGNCGSPLTFKFDSHPDVVWITAGSLDDPNLIIPSENWFINSKLDWVELDHSIHSWPEASG